MEMVTGIPVSPGIAIAKAFPLESEEFVVTARPVEPDRVDEELLSHHMYTAGQPDPDLIIRTSGELRTSGFMLWQSAYTEYYITPAFWPDFGRDELYEALEAYSQRDRRYGGIQDDYGSPHE